MEAVQIKGHLSLGRGLVLFEGHVSIFDSLKMSLVERGSRGKQSPSLNRVDPQEMRRAFSPLRYVSLKDS